MISIITPVYNSERFIEFCIKNVILQNCPDIEHIIVDGGSTDRTVEIIKQYAQKYPHIRWISEKDKGQSDAMNKGIRMASYEILSFLNVDDYYEPNVLNRVLEIFKTLPNPTFLVGNCNLWNDEEEKIHINKPQKMHFYDLLLGWDINPFPANPSAYFYHTSIHEKIGLYDTEDHDAMDLHFLLKTVQVATVKYIDETWGNFRVIKGTKTYNSNQSGETLKRIERILEDYRQKLPFALRFKLSVKRQFYKKKRGLKRRIKYLTSQI